MRRVLIVDLSKNFGGADVRVEQIARDLSAKFDISIAVIDGSQTHHRLKTLGVRLWPLRRARKDPRLVKDLIRLMKRIRPDVVDAHNPQSLLWGLLAAKAAGVPCRIATFHSIFEISEKRRFGRQLYNGLNWLSDKTSTHIVSVSDPVTDFLVERGVTKKKIATIPNGIAVSDGQSAINENRFQIIAVGRLVPVKGIDILLRALAELGDNVPPYECLIVGDGPEKRTLEALSVSLKLAKQVQFLGYRTDPRAFIEKSHVLVMPSYTEGLPFSALEAAAAGVPIIASRVGGLEAYFGPEGAARLVPPGDPLVLAGAIRECMLNPEARAAIASRGRAMVERKFSLGAMLSATARLYEAVDGSDTCREPAGSVTTGERHGLV